MKNRRDRHGHGLDGNFPRKHLLDRSKSGSRILPSDAAGLFEIRIDYGRQAQRLAPLFKFAIDARVIRSKCADTYDGHSDGLTSQEDD